MILPLILFGLRCASGSELNYTNNVCLQGSLHFSLTDKIWETQPEQFVVDREVRGEKTLMFVLQNKGKVYYPILVLRDHPLLLRAFDEAAKPVSMTRMGKAWNKSFAPNFTKKSPGLMDHLGPNPGGLTVRDVGRLTNLFQMTNAGRYYLEARVRYWRQTADGWTWTLSPAVRLPVVVTDPTTGLKPAGGND